MASKIIFFALVIIDAILIAIIEIKDIGYKWSKDVKP